MALFAPKHILCPVDLSSVSPLVLRWANLFAETYGAKLQILYAAAFEYPPYFLPSQQRQLSDEAENERAALRNVLAKLVYETLGRTIAPEILVVEAHPIEAILGYAQSNRPDLIVMGSHGRSSIARMRLGSVAESVMREARTPVLVVRALEDRTAPRVISRVLCPASFTEHAQRCVDFSAQIASAFGAQLFVIHSAEPEGADLQAIRMQLCQWIPTDARRSCEVVELVRQGNAAEQILLAAREHSADLIVLAAQHRPFLEFTTLGTTTERVMRHADSAVLVLPSEKGSRP